MLAFIVLLSILGSVTAGSRGSRDRGGLIAGAVLLLQRASLGLAVVSGGARGPASFTRAADHNGRGGVVIPSRI